MNRANNEAGSMVFVVGLLYFTMLYRPSQAPIFEDYINYHHASLALYVWRPGP